ncbi:MAG: DUF1971 domain-containing protein [Alphaproteobacteria bacterium]
MTDTPPPGTAPYHRTPTFTAATVPAALTAEHSTKAGVWALIHVEAGTLRYEEPRTGRVINLTAGERALVAPQEVHCVTLEADATFFVEFWR